MTVCTLVSKHCILKLILLWLYIIHMQGGYTVLYSKIKHTEISPGLSSGVAGDKRAGLDCTDCTEEVGLTVGSGCSMGDRYCLQ